MSYYVICEGTHRNGIVDIYGGTTPHYLMAIDLKEAKSYVNTYGRICYKEVNQEKLIKRSFNSYADVLTYYNTINEAALITYKFNIVHVDDNKWDDGQYVYKQFLNRGMTTLED